MRPDIIRPAFIVLLAAAAATACGKATPIEPTPELTTATFTGTLQVLGTDSKSFTVKYASSASDGSMTVTALTKVSDGSAAGVTIGVGFGTPATDGSCTRSANYTAPQATIGQELIASSAFTAGTYCIQIYDAGTLVEPVNYTLTVRHF
jgi:hypothetical protein